MEFIGGDISNISGLKNILSIGYEVECGILMKLTKTEIHGSDELILFNSDSSRKDILELKKFEEHPEEIDYNIIDRLEETVEDTIYDDNGKVDKNSVFQITNDIALSPFIKKLKSVCYYNSDETIKTHTLTDEIHDYANEKNQLYLFRDNHGKDYNINFIFKNINPECSTHSVVEWIFTYYKPQRGNNIVVDTFINMIKNLLHHLSDLEPIKGKFIVKLKDIDKDGNETKEEVVIGKPNERILYHKPNTNLYYLLTQISDKPFTIDGACSVFQMTFSAKAENIIDVMIALITDTLKSIDSFNTYINSKLVILLNIKFCVDELFNAYNTTDTKYKFISDTKRNKTRVDVIKSFICLILLKLERFYEFKNSEKPAKYLKNLLYFNSRHSNYDLYLNIKKKIEKFFDVKSVTAINIIKKLIVQPDILKKLVPSTIKLRKGIFSVSNTLEKTNKNYGDPSYSLVSYFDFFEEPIDNETNKNPDTDKIRDYDWLGYKQIDDYTTQMDLKNDIVLVECRIFQKLLSVYVYNIADAELKEQMKNGYCNILTNHYEEDVSSLSIANLKKIVEIHDKLKKEKVKGNKNNTLISDTKKCPADKILNPKTNRCINMCHIEQTRNKKNRCVNNKSNNKSKKVRVKVKTNLNLK